MLIVNSITNNTLKIQRLKQEISTLQTHHQQDRDLVRNKQTPAHWHGTLPRGGALQNLPTQSEVDAHYGTKVNNIRTQITELEGQGTCNQF